MKNVALYIRVSTQEQARHGLSLHDQKEALESYAKTQDMNVVGVYEDAGISARKSYKNRPALMRLLEDCKAGHIEQILFLKLDRWFRSIADYYEVQRVLDAYNVAWQAINEDYETVTASGRFKVNIMLSVAQDEADRTSERVRFAQNCKRERNEAFGKKAPRGYKIVDKHVEIDPEGAETMRAVLKTYFKRGSPSDVIEAFPELHLNYTEVYRIVHSDRYLGNVCGVKAPPIFTPEEHAHALSLRAKAPRRTVDQNRIFLFSGLIVCPSCGRVMASTYHNGKSGEYIYYRCGLHRRHGACSNSKCYKEQDIESYLIDHLEAAVDFTALKIKKEPDKRSTVKRSTLEKKLAKLSDLYLSDLITKDDYAAKYKVLTEQIASLSPDIPPKKPPTLPHDWLSMYESISRKGKQTFWHQLIERITLNDTTVEDFSFR